MRFNQQIKKGAKNALHGNWGKAIAIFMVFIGFWLLMASAENILYLLFHWNAYTDAPLTPEYYLDDILTFQPGQIAVTGFFSLIWFLTLPALFCGAVEWFYRLSGGDSPEFAEFFRCFTSLRRYTRAIAAVLLVGVKSLLWLLVFTAIPVAITVFFQAYPFDPASITAQFAPLGKISGWCLLTLSLFFYILFVQRYFLTCYYLAEKPEITARKAVKLSVEAMHGHCGELFSLKLSFFWWFLCSMLVIPMLYVVPYRCASLSIYARYLMEYRIRSVQRSQAEWREEPVNTAPVADLPPAPVDDQTREYPVSEVREHL